MVVVLSGELASALSRFIQCAGVYWKSKWRSKIRSGSFAPCVVLLRSTRSIRPNSLQPKKLTAYFGPRTLGVSIEW